MVLFQKLRYKNFLSTGNAFTEIDLARNNRTLVVGQNGAGKSTMLDAISFALFGTPHRNITKKQLVNSINGNHCVVEVEFVVGSHNFKIVRKIKPNDFEIWQNGKMINQSSTVRDYQKYLEQNILNLNHRSFHQIVVLGSSNFIPFMQLKPRFRREVIEDLLDINIFSKMNQILKEKVSKNNEELKHIDYELQMISNKIDYQKKYIRDISLINDEHSSKLSNQIQELESKIADIEFANDGLLSKVKENHPAVLSKHDEIVKQKNKLASYNLQFKSKIGSLVKDAKFYEENDNCPTCSQQIDPVLKETKLIASKDKAKEIQEAMKQIGDQLTEYDKQMESINEQLADISKMNMSISGNNREISSLQNQIKQAHAELQNIGKTHDLSTANAELASHMENKDVYSNRYRELLDTIEYDRVAQELLKDTGIKTKIVKEYLPVINKLVNTYLQTMDFFVSFNLDENFEEMIKSRHRDEFNYESFSEGEKQRIDLSLMFTWRQISRMKNSTSTNLLILDETFDSSLDAEGIDNLLKIMNTLDNQTNAFIISHKGDILEDKFPHKLEFVKEKNFSKIKGV